MTASADIAVVIPAYDSAPTLGATIASALAQTLTPREVIVVDDGSQDDCAVIAQAAGARVVRRSNGGPGAARNTGIAATSCSWIAFLDADDVFEPEKLARQWERLVSTGGAACCTDAWLWREGAPLVRKNASRQVPSRIEFATLLTGNPIVCSSMLVRRDLLLASGCFDEDRVLIATEDYDLWLRIAKQVAIEYLDQPLVRYRVGRHSLTSNERFLRGVDRIFAKLAIPQAPVRIATRIDWAYDLVAAGQRVQARGLLREARALGGGGTRHWKLWLKSWLPKWVASRRS